MTRPTLHLLCGKIASGKSTLAAGLAAAPDTVLIVDRLHYLRQSDATCRARLRTRNAAGTHEYEVSDDQFDIFTAGFIEPDPAEGFHVVVHD